MTIHPRRHCRRRALMWLRWLTRWIARLDPFDSVIADSNETHRNRKEEKANRKFVFSVVGHEWCEWCHALNTEALLLLFWYCGRHKGVRFSANKLLCDINYVHRFKCTWSLHYYCAFSTCSDAHTQCLDVSLRLPRKRFWLFSLSGTHSLRMNLFALDFPCANNTPTRSYICIFSFMPISTAQHSRTLRSQHSLLI